MWVCTIKIQQKREKKRTKWVKITHISRKILHFLLFLFFSLLVFVIFSFSLCFFLLFSLCLFVKILKENIVCIWTHVFCIRSFRLHAFTYAFLLTFALICENCGITIRKQCFLLTTITTQKKIPWLFFLCKNFRMKESGKYVRKKICTNIIMLLFIISFSLFVKGRHKDRQKKTFLFQLQPMFDYTYTFFYWVGFVILFEILLLRLVSFSSKQKQNKHIFLWPELEKLFHWNRNKNRK